jgi:hypothetical protein
MYDENGVKIAVGQQVVAVSGGYDDCKIYEGQVMGLRYDDRTVAVRVINTNTIVWFAPAQVAVQVSDES